MNLKSKPFLVTLIWVIPIYLLITEPRKTVEVNKHNSAFQVMLDTIEGNFLYEVNVPSKAYTRFDQIERGNNLIFYDSLFASKDISHAYQNGIFVLDYESIIQKYLKDHKNLHLSQDPNLWRFIKRVSLTTHQQDSLYMNTLCYDQSKIFSFKRIKAKLVVIHLGLIKQLIPSANNYKCCYTKNNENIDTYFVLNILDFAIIEKKTHLKL